MSIFIDKLLNENEPITNIGQLSKEEIRELEKLVRRGKIQKGKGGHFPKEKTVYAPLNFDIKTDRQKAYEEMLLLQQYEPNWKKLYKE